MLVDEGPRAVATFRGEVASTELGTTLIHEHVFVTDPELDRALPHPEWNEAGAIQSAIDMFDRLYALGVRTVVDLTVPGLGRNIARVARVAERTSVQLVAATGFYCSETLPHAIGFHGPGRLIGGPDPLIELFVNDIERGIEGTSVRAGMIKVVSDAPGFTPDVIRVFEAAAAAHAQTGTPITTHSHAATKGGRAQQDRLEALGVPLDRVVIGHSGDSTDIAYLRELADRGSYLGFDRFGMAHTASDDDRIRTLLALLDLGYAERIVLSHDAAIFSRVTPPSWRARATPNWRMDYLPTVILPLLEKEGADASTLRTLMVDNPRRVLAGA